MPAMTSPTTSHHATRRARLRERLDGAAALFVSGRAPTRSNTIAYPFRPDSDFFYLTGFKEPDAALLLRRGPAGDEAIAFVRPRDPLAETWNGRRLGVEAACEALGVERAYPYDELGMRLPELLAGHDALCYALGRHGDVDAWVMDAVCSRPRSDDAPASIVHPRAALHELRVHKGAEELAAMRRSADATAVAFARAVDAIRPGNHEYDVQAALESAFLAAGGCPAYIPIVAGGANATILHYTENDQRLQDGELVLVDAGAEVGCYASDVTRTYPINGTFTPMQRAVYSIVLDAQEAAMAALRVGEPATRYHAVSDEVLTRGLVALGVLAGDVASLIAEGAHKAFTLHRAGHFLGLDTHDVGRVSTAGTARPLESGMVLTVEPGLYFAADDERVDPGLRGIGVRIEDDVLITSEGPQVLTAMIPKPDPRG